MLIVFVGPSLKGMSSNFALGVSLNLPGKISLTVFYWIMYFGAKVETFYIMMCFGLLANFLLIFARGGYSSSRAIQQISLHIYVLVNSLILFIVSVEPVLIECDKSWKIE